MSRKQDLIDAIRRIARTDPDIRSLLDAARRRGTLPGERGSSAGASEIEDLQDQIDDLVDTCCDTTDEDTKDDTPTDDVTDIPDDGDMGDEIGELCGLTDCATGQPVCVNMSGDYKIPDGWGDINDGPTPPGYTDGYYWEDYSGRRGQYPKKIWDRVYEDFGDAEYLSIEFPTIEDARIDFCFNNCTSFASALYRRRDCSQFYDAYYCELPPPIEKWPCDGVPQIGFLDGRFMTHQQDCDGADYLEPRDDIILCDGDGDRLRLVADKFEEGGFLTVPVDANGDPIDGKIVGRYGANGKKVGTILPEQVDSYARKPVDYNN